MLMSPHVSKKDQSKISVRRFHMGIADLDEDEVLKE